MLTIRKEQMHVFQSALRDSFEKRVAAQLQDSFPEQLSRLSQEGALPDGALGLVRAGIEKAGTYGIRAEGDVTRFLELMVRLSPGFDEDLKLHWTKAVLQDEELPPGGKLELIDRRLRSN